MFSRQKRNGNYVARLEMLANAMVVTILQHRNVSNHHIVNLKRIQCYMSIVSQLYLL